MRVRFDVSVPNLLVILITSIYPFVRLVLQIGIGVAALRYFGVQI